MYISVHLFRFYVFAVSFTTHFFFLRSFVPRRTTKGKYRLKDSRPNKIEINALEMIMVICALQPTDYDLKRVENANRQLGNEKKKRKKTNPKRRSFNLKYQRKRIKRAGEIFIFFLSFSFICFRFFWRSFCRTTILT